MRKFIYPKEISWNEVIRFLQWKFDLTDDESEDLFHIQQIRTDRGKDCLRPESGSYDSLSQLPDKLSAYHQREIDYLYRPGGKLFKRAQYDYNVTRTGVDDQPRRFAEELGPYRLEEKTLRMSIFCIQHFFGNDPEKALEIIQKHILEDCDDEYPMLVAVLEKQDTSLADYLTKIVISQIH